MNNPSFSISIVVDQSPEHVFRAITEVPKWWTSDFTGKSGKLNDEFVIDHGDPHYSKQKVVESIPGEKLVWLVTEGRLGWLQHDKNEWTNTRMVFEITTQGDKTHVHFTHEGLVPEKECFARCKEGWTMVINERLYNYLTAGGEI